MAGEGAGKSAAKFGVLAGVLARVLLLIPFLGTLPSTLPSHFLGFPRFSLFCSRLPGVATLDSNGIPSKMLSAAAFGGGLPS